LTALGGNVVPSGAEGSPQEAAHLWALATARRDGHREPRSAQECLPGVQRRLALPGAELLVARAKDGAATGFALFAHGPACLEVFYLAVHPDAWGTGVATELLARVEQRARELGHVVLELWVIDDNERAVAVYERSGWVDTGTVQRDEPSGRPERRLRRTLAPAPGVGGSGLSRGR